MGDFGMDVEIILKRTLKKQATRMWTGTMLPRTESNGGLS
jgi:hypothetical protein